LALTSIAAEASFHRAVSAMRESLPVCYDQPQNRRVSGGNIESLLRVLIAALVTQHAWEKRLCGGSESNT